MGLLANHGSFQRACVPIFCSTLHLLATGDVAISWLAVGVLHILKLASGDMTSWAVGDTISWNTAHFTPLQLFLNCWKQKSQHKCKNHNWNVKVKTQIQILQHEYKSHNTTEVNKSDSIRVVTFVFVFWICIHVVIFVVVYWLLYWCSEFVFVFWICICVMAFAFASTPLGH